MNDPEKIKIISLGNVFCRMMILSKKGDIVDTHKHYYDHCTLVSRGSVLVEVLDDNNNVESFKEFLAPTFVYVNKDKHHKLTALEDDTLCICIHAIRDNNEEIISPEFIPDIVGLPENSKVIQDNKIIIKPFGYKG